MLRLYLVAGLPPFGKHIAHSVMYLFTIYLGFEGMNLVQIVSVPGHCFFIYKL